MRNKRILLCVFVVLAISVFCSVDLLSNVVFASGTGSDSSGVCNHDCGDPEWWGVYPYDEPGKGGISWKMFRTKSEYWNGYKLYKIGNNWTTGVIHCKDPSDQASTGKCTTIGALRGFGYDKQLATKCYQAGYDWYIALASDGFYKNDIKTTTRYFGPSSVTATYETVNGNDSYLYKSKAIQTYNMMAKNDVLAALRNNTLAEGQRVDEATAKYFCAKANTGLCTNYSNVSNSFPDDLGYICVRDDEWQAQSVLSGSASATAGYSKDTASQTGFANNCNSTNGCSVTFKHNIKRTSGDGTTAYTVSRTSNLTKSDDSAKGVDNNSNVASGYSNADGSAKQVSTNSFTLYPGMIVCERITYKSVPDSADVYSEVCASALGKAQPDDPPADTPEDPGSTPTSGNSAFINVKVRNKSVAAYNKYQRSVYAKPTDKIRFRVVYNPRLQYTYRLKTTSGRMKMKVDGGTLYDGNNTSLGTLFNAKVDPDWNNDYAVGSNFAESNRNYQHSVDNTPGDISIKTEGIPGSGTDDYYTVLGTSVGQTLTETATVNNGIVQKRGSGSNNNKTTPWQVEFTSSGNVNVANVKTTSAPSKTASVLVPYNYRNEAKVTNTNTTVYAGESFTVKHDYIVNPKTNSLTSPSTPYVTNIGDPRWKIRLRIEGGASYWSAIHKPGSDDNSFTFSDSEINNAKTISKENPINVPDIAAGKRICVQTAVYPKDSYNDGNLNKNAYDINNANSWAYSPEVCFTVAKKPSFQVWGGNIYSRGKVATSISSKRSLAGYESYNYKIEGNNGVHVFGSFGELGLIASGTVTGLSSGANTGYGDNNDGVLSPNPFGVNNATNAPNPGGGTTANICNRSTLTFANNPCNENIVGQLGKTSTTNNIDNDKNNILGKFIKELESSNTGSPVVLNDRSKAQADGTYYYYSTDNLDVGNSAVETAVASSTVQMVHSKKTLFVKGNLVYNDVYQRYSELPKLVLYGKNVVIDCNVTRIDALIIADEKVVTCNNFSDTSGNSNVENNNLNTFVSNHINDAANSNQLKINGAVVTKTLIANRTYGAAAGANSIVPAEIINFDPTLYMWGGLGNEEGSDGDLEVTLTNELAPRK